MIISASRRTDIPALYSQWFMNRLREGEVLVPNPYNRRKVSRIRLSPEVVDGIVFWTKNPEPLLPYLRELDAMGYRYCFQYTITDYGKDLEPGVYSVQETKAPEGYVIDPTEYHVELFPGQVSELVVSNDRKPNLEIVKTDAVTGSPVADVTFTVKKVDSSTLTTVKTDAEGKALIENLDPGVYEVWEQSVPDNYLLNDEHQLITLVPNRTGTVRFQNYPKPGLTIVKVDSITGDPIKGAKFHITYASNDTFEGEINDLGTYYTDEAGQKK